ncbi:MAG: molybdenum cofactor biosynthesis protein MoaE, partial [Myxococcota bacterium]|nr:molybdenum cofactor biosynthesis protein MoaE [Myxococcota bacterium]
IHKKYPQLKKCAQSLRWAQNFEFVIDDCELKSQDEIALIPPVAGGSALAHVSESPLSLDEILTKIRDSNNGAAVFFLGSVRRHAQGKTVTKLSYEAYEPMASQELDRIAHACGKSEEAKVYIAHRSGTLKIGDIAVIIAAAAPHRDAAFKACRNALEALKKDVPIWKKEFYEDGESWIGWGGG